MKDSEYLESLKEIRRHLRSKKGFGKDICEELHMGCASCKGQIAIGYINWLIDLEEFSQENQPMNKDSKATDSDHKLAGEIIKDLDRLYGKPKTDSVAILWTG